MRRIEHRSISISQRVYRLVFRSRQRGFSLPELLTVLGIIGILSAISLPYILNYRKVYRSEDQAIKLIDLMTEAGQLALTRRRTVRLEIDLTDNAVKMIGENLSAPDTLIKSIPLDKTPDLRVDVKPDGVTKPDPPNYTDISYAADSVGHQDGSTTVINHSVWAARFQRDGSVVNAAGNPLSVNIYVWPPAAPGSLTPRNVQEVRVITLFGGSGAIRLWKHDGSNFYAS